MEMNSKKIRIKSIIQIPLSIQLKEINRDLRNKKSEMILLELDGISEMFVNYVKKIEDMPMRFKFIGTLVTFINKYKYLAKLENLNIIKIILLNELYKKNINEPSVMMLIKNEMLFNEKNVAAFKFVIKKELREVCMSEYNISDRSDPRYKSVVKPMVRDFEDFYYSFR